MFYPEKPKPKRDSRRAFSQSQKNEIWAQQDGKCASKRCDHSKLDPRSVQYDHKKEWCAGGRTLVKNGRALCGNCHNIETHNQRLKATEKKTRAKKDAVPDFTSFLKPTKKKGGFF